VRAVDPIFKGCTRPAMMLGVPLTPLVIAVGAAVLIGTYTNMLLMLLLGPVVLVMRAVVATDDQRFRSIGLFLQFRFIHLDRNRGLWKASSYSPITFKKR